MSSKLLVSTILSGYRANTTLNQNFNLLASAFDNTLSRDGTAPNFMLAPLDMNGQKVINLAAPTAANDAVRLVDIQGLTAGTGGGSGTDDDPQTQWTYATRTDAAAASVPVAVPAIYVAGYTTAGDGGGAKYVRLGGVPAHLAYFVDALGNYWGLNEAAPNLKMFGAKCDGTTNDAGAWTRAGGYGSFVSVPVGTTLTNASVSLPSGFTVVGAGYLSRVKATNTFGDIPVFTNATVGPTTTGGRDHDITITNVVVDGNKANNGGASQNAHGINVQAVVNFRFEGWIEHCHGDAIYLGASQTTQTIGCEDTNIWCRQITDMYRQGVTLICTKRTRIQIDYATGCTQQVVDVEPNNSSNANTDIDIRILKADTNGSGAFNSVVGLDGSFDNIANVNVYIEYVTAQTGQVVSFRGGITGLRYDGVYWDCTNGAKSIQHFAGATHSPTNVNVGPIVIQGSGNASTGSGLCSINAVDTFTMSCVFKACGQNGNGVLALGGSQNFLFTGKIINPAFIGLYINSGCLNTRILNATVTGSTNRAIYITDSTYTIITSCDLSNNNTPIQEGGTTDYGTYRNNICSGASFPISMVGAHSNQAANKGVAAPTVTGSRGGNAALANLLTVLQNQESITNGTSA